MDKNKDDILSASSGIFQSYNRIKDYINNTPLLSSPKINKDLGAQIFFKMENLQITNSFKIRGAFNAVLSYKDINGYFPKKIVVQSSGNHAHAMAYVAKKFGIELVIYMASNVSQYKIDKIKQYGAKIIICQERSEANYLAELLQEQGYYFIHPSDNDDVILGQATCAVEILNEISDISAIFIPCGGGGLVSGCYIASQQFDKNIKIYACEPKQANDVAISVKQNNIFSFSKSPQTVADGARTLAISDRCFQYLKKIADILEIEEERIIYWQNQLEQIFKCSIEPTSALSIAGLEHLIKNDESLLGKKLCCIITGGNTGSDTKIRL